MATVLVLGDDTGPCLSVARSLGRRGIEVHLTRTGRAMASAASRYVSRTHIIPKYTDAGQAWLGRIDALVGEHAYDLLIPTSDSSLAQLLRHRDELGGCRVAVPNSAAAEIFVDKMATRRLAEELGVPVPAGHSIEDNRDTPAIGNLRLPAVLKRRRSYACGDSDQKSPVRLVRDPAELRRELAGAPFELIEEFVPGYCRGLSVLAREGEIRVAHQHRRLRQEHVTGPSSSRISEAVSPQLLDWVRAMVGATRLTGVAMFEFRCDPASGRTVLLEVNPRFWGSLPLALSAGADFPATLYAMIAENRDPVQQIGSHPGVEKRNVDGERYAFAVALEQARSPGDYLRLALTAASSAALLVGGRRFDSWAPDDPEPFRAERRALLADVLGYCRVRIGRLGRGGSLAVR